MRILRWLLGLLFVAMLAGGVLAQNGCGTDNPGDNSQVVCDSDDASGFDGGANTGLDVTVNPGVNVDPNPVTSDGIQVGADAVVENNGNITGNDDGIQVGGNADVTNNGSIDASWGVYDSSGVGGNEVTNNGSITVDNSAVLMTDNNTITNNGPFATIQTGSNGISVSSNNQIDNSGSISAGGNGIVANDGNQMTNTGSINADSAGIAVDNGNQVNNVGFITSGTDGIEVQDGNTVNNSGAITATENGIVAGNDNTITNNGAVIGQADGIQASEGSTITNSATVTGNEDGIDVNDGSVTNTGTVKGGDDGIEIDGSAGTSIDNSGTIEGDVGINEVGGGNDTLVNSGTIRGRGGLAVEMGDGDDSVTLVDGSVIDGIIDGGSGSDTITLDFDVGELTEGDAGELADSIAQAMENTNATGAGTLTIDGQVYTWTNYEELVSLITWSIRDGHSVDIPSDVFHFTDGRLNAYDVGAPVAVYCAHPNAIEVWDIGADGSGTLAFSISLLRIWGGGTGAGLGDSLVRTAEREVQVIAPDFNGGMYVFSFDPNVCASS